jgi:hypothetical protein
LSVLRAAQDFPAKAGRADFSFKIAAPRRSRVKLEPQSMTNTGREHPYRALSSAKFVSMPFEVINIVISLAFLAVCALVSSLLVRQL